MARALVFAVALALLGSASHAAETLVLKPGERVVVRLDAGGEIERLSARAARPGEALPPRPRAGAADAPLPDSNLAPGTAAFTLAAVDGDLALKIESGVDKAFDYRIAQADGRRLKACTVLPLLESYERWTAPGPLTLSGLVLRPTNEVVCAPEETR